MTSKINRITINENAINYNTSYFYIIGLINKKTWNMSNLQ